PSGLFRISSFGFRILSKITIPLRNNSKNPEVIFARALRERRSPDRRELMSTRRRAEPDWSPPVAVSRGARPHGEEPFAVSKPRILPFNKAEMAAQEITVPTDSLGIIAGIRSLPLLFARQARSLGVKR